jgi:glucose/arabinose dehydrogenase
MQRLLAGLATLIVATLIIVSVRAEPDAIVLTDAGPMRITRVAEGLVEPWAIDFLPDGGVLITERGAALKFFSQPLAEPIVVGGLPEVAVFGQAGLLDLMVPRDFADTRELWFTYAMPKGTGAATAVAKAVLSADASRLEGFVTLFELDTGSDDERHFGARLVEAADGTVFATIGDRGTGPKGMAAQDLLRGEGKVIHLNRDGTPATQLTGTLAGVYSLGHRNPQGATLDLAGRLLTVEHGPQGGDELNAPEQGGNYGWPLVSYGLNYNDTKVGLGSALPGIEPPLHYWDPSIAPSGLMVYSGKLVPEWRGDIFFGSLNSDFLGRLDPETPAVNGYGEERIAARQTGRVRDVVEAPDGAIWFLSVHDGAAYRLAPEP